MAEPRGAPDVQEWAPDLQMIRAANAAPMTLDGTRSYVLGTMRVVVVDPGPDDPDQLDALAAAVAARPVAAVLLTHAHADHAAGAEAAARRFGTQPAGSAQTLARLGLDGRALEDGETLGLGDDAVGTTGLDATITAIHAPGHSADHVCYLAMPGRRLFTGDLVLGEGSSAILHPDGSVADCLASLARLISLRPSLLLPGHGPPVTHAVRKLEEYRRHRLEREKQVLAALAAGAATVPEIRRAVYGELPPGLVRAADASVGAHLAALSTKGEEVPPFDQFGAAEDDHG